MTEVGGEIWKTALRVDSLFVPHRHPMDDKGMTKVVDARSCATGGILKPGNSNQSPEMSARGDVTVTAFRMPE